MPQLSKNRPTIGLDVVDKPWGIARRVHRSAACEVWYADVLPGGRSSWHTHRLKANDFYVLTGEVRISLGPGGVVLYPGDSYSVEPGVIHRFESDTGCQMIETYWLPEIDPDDIEREA